MICLRTFSLAYFIARIQYIVHTQNRCQYLLSARLLSVNSRLLVKFLGSQEFWGFSVVGVGAPSSTLFKGQLCFVKDSTGSRGGKGIPGRGNDLRRRGRRVCGIKIFRRKFW